MVKHKKYGHPLVDYILEKPPLDRVHKSGNDLEDEIIGILVGFAAVLNNRNGWIDFITTEYATAEIKDLIERQKNAAS